jgi:hypothetical protein
MVPLSSWPVCRFFAKATYTMPRRTSVKCMCTVSRLAILYNTGRLTARKDDDSYLHTTYGTLASNSFIMIRKAKCRCLIALNFAQPRSSDVSGMFRVVAADAISCGYSASCLLHTAYRSLLPSHRLDPSHCTYKAIDTVVCCAWLGLAYIRCQWSYRQLSLRLKSCVEILASCNDPTRPSRTTVPYHHTK